MENRNFRENKINISKKKHFYSIICIFKKVVTQLSSKKLKYVSKENTK